MVERRGNPAVDRRGIVEVRLTAIYPDTVTLYVVIGGYVTTQARYTGVCRRLEQGEFHSE